MRKFALVAVLTAIALFSAVAIPAGAAPYGVLAFGGKATLNGHGPTAFPCTGITCTGTFAGTGNGRGLETAGSKQIVCQNCKITASYKYSEPGGKCVSNVPLAATGTANGTITTFAKPKAITSHFAWTRVGVVAVVTLSNPLGASVAAFIPPSTCKIKTATIEGIAVFA